MIRWRTVNQVEEEDDEQNANYEILTENYLNTYQEALRIHQRGFRSEAKAKYDDILGSDLMNDQDIEEDTKGEALYSSSLVMLRFLVFKNYAAILDEEYREATFDTNDDMEKKAQQAMDYYLKALEVDGTDRALWHRLGALAYGRHNYRLARTSFEHGMALTAGDPLIMNADTEQALRSGSIAPQQWLCLEGLCRVMFDIGDFAMCERLVAIGLARHGQWELGKDLREQMAAATRATPQTDAGSSQLDDLDDTMQLDAYTPAVSVSISKVTWHHVLLALMQQYEIDNQLRRASGKQRKGAKDDHSGTPAKFINRAIYIDMDDADMASATRTKDPSPAAPAPILIEASPEPSEPPAQPEALAPPPREEQPTIRASLYNAPIAGIPFVAPPPPGVVITYGPPVFPVYGGSSIHPNHAMGATPFGPVPPFPPAQHAAQSSQVLDKMIVDLTLSDDDEPPKPIKKSASDLENALNASENAASASENAASASEDAANATENAANATKNAVNATENAANTPENAIGAKRKLQDAPDDKQPKDDEQQEEQEGDNDDDLYELPTLRASKRQKQKQDTEEVLKQQMMKEEDELYDKMQDLVATLDEWQRGEKWSDPIKMDVVASLPRFLNYFDHKVSELSITYTWTLDTADYAPTKTNLTRRRNSNAQLMAADNGGKAHSHPYMTFTKRTDMPMADADVEPLTDLIRNLNVQNAGAMEALCRAMLTLLAYHADRDAALEQDTVHALLKAFDLMGDTFINTCAARLDIDTYQKVTMFICEILADELIMRMMDGPAAASRGGTGSNKSAPPRAEDLQALCQHWIAHLEQLWFAQAMGDRSATATTCEIDTILDDGSVYMDDDRRDKILLRYWLLKGKLALCTDNAELALTWYDKCNKLLQTLPWQDQSFTLPCRFDATINEQFTKNKLGAIALKASIFTAKASFENKKYDAVLQYMEPLMQDKMDELDHDGLTDGLFEIIMMVAKCHVKLKQCKDAWTLYGKMLARTTCDMVHYGAKMATANTIAPCKDDTEFYRLFGMIDAIVHEMADMLSHTPLEDWLAATVDTELLDSLLILLRTSMVYIFRHPDFIPLVNNFATPDSTPHVPSRRTIANFFNALSTRAWVLVATLMERRFHDDNDKMMGLASVLQTLHDELGEREICGAGNGIFLQYLMRILGGLDMNDNRSGVYQCYHCLFGILLAKEGEMVEEHHATHGSMDDAAAERLYRLIIDDVLEKLHRNVSLKHDLKDGIDNVAELYDKLPLGIANVSVNTDFVKAYLDKEINVSQPIETILQQCTMPISDIRAKMPSLTCVYDQIFWIRGRMLRILIKNRPKIVTERTFLDLEEAAEQFQYHVIMHPEDQLGWYDLGTTLMYLAEEELIWSAANIKKSASSIAKYQRQAFNSLMKTWQLSRDGDKLPMDVRAEFFVHFGYLVESMVCAPMNMAAFQTTAMLTAMDDQGQLRQVARQKKLPNEESAKHLSLRLYSRGLMPSAQDRWKTFFAIGNCFSRLKRPATESADWFMRALKNCPNSQNDYIQPLYKLCACLAKALHRREISPEKVQSYMHQVQTMSLSVNILGPTVSNAAHASTSTSSPATSSPSSSAAPSLPIPSPSTQHHAMSRPPMVLSSPSALSPSMSTATTPPQGPKPGMILQIDADGRAHLTTPTSGIPSIIDLTDSSTTAPIRRARTMPKYAPVTKKAFDMLFEKLLDIQRVDKKHWHHRPIYRLAWMHDKIYADPDKAKDELLQLFTLKATNKGVVNIWKPDLERPGKHFVYVTQYILFLVDLARATHDAETLKNLCRKLRKSSHLVFDDKATFQSALHAYVEVCSYDLDAEGVGSKWLDCLLTGYVNLESFISVCNNWRHMQTTRNVGDTPSTRWMTVLLDLWSIRTSAHNFVDTDHADQLLHRTICRHLFAEMPLANMLSKEPTNDKREKVDISILNNVVKSLATTLAK
ncbi:hypothetical protein BC940DRAFT_160374 [Gongronella butleri]|nr:hypothetical protein BC940DRAFT_160374 [Gongronella butleri]